LRLRLFSSRFMAGSSQVKPGHDAFLNRRSLSVATTDRANA
jgi:hypothetical protein